MRSASLALPCEPFREAHAILATTLSAFVSGKNCEEQRACGSLLGQPSPFGCQRRHRLQEHSLELPFNRLREQMRSQFVGQRLGRWRRPRTCGLRRELLAVARALMARARAGAGARIDADGARLGAGVYLVRVVAARAGASDSRRFTVAR